MGLKSGEKKQLSLRQHFHENRRTEGTQIFDGAQGEPQKEPRELQVGLLAARQQGTLLRETLRQTGRPGTRAKRIENGTDQVQSGFPGGLAALE